MTVSNGYAIGNNNKNNKIRKMRITEVRWRTECRGGGEKSRRSKRIRQSKMKEQEGEPGGSKGEIREDKKLGKCN